MSYDKFWRSVYQQITIRCHFFDNSRWKSNFLEAESDYWQIFYKLAIKKKEIRSELFFGRYETSENKALFDELYKKKDKIELDYGTPLHWERIDDKKLCRISIRKYIDNIDDESHWPEIIQWMIDNVIKIESVFRTPLADAFEALPWIRKSSYSTRAKIPWNR